MVEVSMGKPPKKKTLQQIQETCLQSQLPAMEVHRRELGRAGIHHMDVPGC